MIATLWQLKWWLVNVGPNIVASAVCFTAGLTIGWLKWGRDFMRRFGEHERKVSELHAHFKPLKK